MKRLTARRLWRYWILAGIIPAFLRMVIIIPHDDICAANTMLLSMVTLIAIVAMILFFRSESYLSKGRVGVKMWFVASVCSLSWYLDIWKDSPLYDTATIHDSGWLIPIYCCSCLILGCLSHILQVRKRIRKSPRHRSPRTNKPTNLISQ